MPSPIAARYGPFTKGVNARIEAMHLEPATPVDASNVDLSRGTLACHPNCGNPLLDVVVPVTSKFLCYAGRHSWIYSDYPQFALNDAGSTYYTQLTDETGLAASYPMIKRGSFSAARLGIVAPTAAPTVTTNDSFGVVMPSGTYYFKYAYGNSPVSSSVVVSNLSPVSSAYVYTDDGGARRFALSVAGNPNDLTQYGSTYVYAATDPAGPFYYIGASNSSASAHTAYGSFTVFPPTSTSGFRTANWGPGGTSSSTSTPYDHSPAPNLTVLANQLHSVAAGSGGGGAGILFGAVDNVVWWSELGQPLYWPTTNYMPLPDTVEALFTHAAQTFAFTRSAVYSFSGVDDEGLSQAKTNAGFGVAEGAGRTVAQTPYGIMFVADDGLAIFDGRDARIVSAGFLPDDYFRDFTTMSAAYWDAAYILFHSAGTLVFDLSLWPEIRMVPNPAIVPASHVTLFEDADYNQQPGLHVLLDGDAAGAVYPWGAGGVGAVYGVGDTAASYAGSNSSGHVNGTRSEALFNPSADSDFVILPNGDIVVADSNNNVLRLISGDTVSDWTYPGSGGGSISVDAGREDAVIMYPSSMAIDNDGNVFVVAGLSMNVILKIDTSGYVTRYAGSLTVSGHTYGDRLTTARLRNVISMDVDNAGNLYLTCDGDTAIDRIVAATGQMESYLTYADIPGRTAGDFWPRTIMCDRTNDLLYFTDVGGTSFGSAAKFFVADAAQAVTALATNIVSSTQAYGLAMDALGSIYMVQNGPNHARVWKYSNGAWSHFWGLTSSPWMLFSEGPVATSGLANPHGIRIGTQGEIFVLDNNRIAWVDGVLLQGSTWSYETSDFTAGEPDRLKEFHRIKIAATGTISAAVYVDDVLVATVAESGWLPQCSGYRLKLIVSSEDGSGEVKWIEVQGVLYDGT